MALRKVFRFLVSKCYTCIPKEPYELWVLNFYTDLNLPTNRYIKLDWSILRFVLFCKTCDDILEHLFFECTHVSKFLIEFFDLLKIIFPNCFKWETVYAWMYMYSTNESLMYYILTIIKNISKQM